MKKYLYTTILILTAASAVWLTAYGAEVITDAKEEGMRRFVQSQIEIRKGIWQEQEGIIQKARSVQETVSKEAKSFRLLEEALFQNPQNQFLKG